MDLSNFSNTAQQLASLTETAPPPADVLDDKVDDVKRFLKETGEGIGSTLSTHAGLKGLEKAFKTPKINNVLKKLGVEDKDIEGIVAKLKDGDVGGAISDITKGGVKKLTSTVEDTVKGLGTDTGNVAKSDLAEQIESYIPKGLTSTLKNATYTEVNPFEVSSVAARIKLPPLNKSVTVSDILKAQFEGKQEQIAPKVSQFEEFAGSPSLAQEDVATSAIDRIPLQTLKPAERVLADITGKAKAPKSFEVENPAFSPAQYQEEEQEPVENSVKSGVKAVDDEVDKVALKEGEEVVEKNTAKKLATLAEESVVDDENPLGLAISATLGIGSLVASLFSKDHHKKFIQPPTQEQHSNFVSQLGVLPT